MGIVDMLKEREAQKILEKGEKAGLKKGLEKGKIEGKAEVVCSLVTRLGLSDAQAADIAGVPVAFVKKVRLSLKKKK